ncbi:MAG: two-component system, NarL family, sensor histidine kinase DegS [Candidatus Frackibacter sp. T328-2]|nr:MAG: two-component system, NarL family, sensor histidine kinase DegS [Candidatus Frackibacter sp. T328-2]
MDKKLGVNSLDQVVDKMVTAIDDSQGEVFEIAEAARQEHEAAEKDLKDIKEETVNIIQKVDDLREANRKARMNLMKVSQDLDDYSETDIKEAYEKAKDIQVELSLFEEKEKRMRQKRDELERRLKGIEEAVERAENLVSQIKIIKDFLANDLQEFSSQMEGLKQKEQLGIKIIEAQEEERKRVAREIHDGPAQLLANVVFKVDYSQKLLDNDVGQAKEELQELKKLVRKSLQDVRKIIFDLRPMTLDDLGLIPTVRKYIEDFMEKTGLDIQIKVLSEETDLKPSHEVVIYRIIQEALNNINQHAQAKRVDIKLELKCNLMNVVIKDDGCGFNVDEVLEGQAGKSSFGLLSMKERVELVQGNIKFESQKGKGTKITLKIPV